MSKLVEDILTQQTQYASERSTFDSLNQEIAELVLPEHAVFTSQTTQGQKRAQKQYDSTAQTEAGRHASAIDSMSTPHRSKWHGLASTDPTLNKRDDVQQYFGDVSDILFAERYADDADFAAQIFDVWRGGGVFGTTGLHVGDHIGGGLRYRAQNAVEIFIALDAWGQVCRLHRVFTLTALAAYEEYGEACPKSIKDAYPKEPLKKFKFLHAVMKNPDDKPGYLNSGMAFVDYEIAIDDKHLLRQGGHYSWPMPVYRYDVAPGEWYGRGWANAVLPEIKMLNRTRKAHIRQTEKAADPPLLAFDDGMLTYGSDGTGNTPSLGAGDIHWGGVNAQGQELVKPLFTGADLSRSYEQIKDSRAIIKEASLTALFQILVDNPQMTATEWLGRMQEKGQLIAPMVGRSISTFLGKVVDRELEILSRQQKLPPMPKALMEAGGAYRIEYSSPLSRLMQLEEVTATEGWLQSLIPIAQIDPGILDNVDFDEYARHAGRIRGVPAKIMVDQDVVIEKRAAKQKAAQMQQMIDAAPGVAGAIKDVALAGKASRESEVGSSVLALRQALKG